MKRRLQERGGFTLLELLMVVIIIAILASIALPQYLRVAERTRVGEALQVLGAMRTSELRYQAQHPDNLFTSDPNELDIGLPGYQDPMQPPGTLLPVSLQWNPYTADDVAETVTAQRDLSSTAFGGSLVTIHVPTGEICSDNPVYGLPASTTNCTP